MLLTPNKYSRPQTPLKKVEKIVVHYTANPMSTAKNNRDYFENLRNTHYTYVSSHYVIGLDGEIIRCVPENEVAYCSNSANGCSISIENCHSDKSGKLNAATVSSLKELLADLCRRYKLNPKADIIRHYDVTGKLCPLWYVEHNDEWERLKTDVAGMLNPPKPEQDDGFYSIWVGKFKSRADAEKYGRKISKLGAYNEIRKEK